VLTLLQEQEFICIVFSTEYKRTRSIVTPTPLYLFSRAGEPWPIATGDKLGDMQSELKTTEFIIEFASGGQKNYSYRLITNEGEKTVCKVRGITLNYHASKLVNFEII